MQREGTPTLSWGEVLGAYLCDCANYARASSGCKVAANYTWPKGFFNQNQARCAVNRALGPLEIYRRRFHPKISLLFFPEGVSGRRCLRTLSVEQFEVPSFEVDVDMAAGLALDAARRLSR